ncbi:MAG: lipopolysaccharide transport periplasmic protein LptA [Deltaproteobacteria bacterium]|nr:lipopolysaccharide transport periplasmic protein LptA [Deltaproteobacteria bacterium]
MKYCWIAIAFLLLSFESYAQQKSTKGSNEPEGPVDIRSDELTVYQKKHQAVFSGNVRAVQGELVINCKQLTVFYAGNNDSQANSGEITKMVFSGDVSIKQKARKGHCEKAVYHRPASRIVCTGKAWVVEGNNRIEGVKIEYFLGKDEVKVTRPKAIIHLPDKKEKQGSEK